MREYGAYYRIATSLAGLETGANFFIRGLPAPEAPAYSDFTIRLPGGQGGESRQGYENAGLLWLRLSPSQAATLSRLVDEAEVSGGPGNGTLYLTIPKANGAGPGWIDISGIAIRPDFTPGQLAGGLVYDNVILRLNNVTVEADPSTVG